MSDGNPGSVTDDARLSRAGDGLVHVVFLGLVVVWVATVAVALVRGLPAEVVTVVSAAVLGSTLVDLSRNGG